MPTFDFKGIYTAEYKQTEAGYGYGDVMEMGEAMNCTLQMKYAEGRLYAKGALREYKKIPTGGTLSIGVKYIPQAVQRVMFRKTSVNRTINEKEVVSDGMGSSNIPQYMGVGAYAPDVVDGKDMISAIFVHKALFGAPGYTYATKGENLTFQTPTTTGEFLPSDVEGEMMVEDITVETEQEAIDWIRACFGAAAAGSSEVSS